MSRVYFENLYENIIEKHAPNAIELNVITGYSSANFIRFISKKFSHLKINIFLGMTSLGITRSDHDAFVSIVDDNNPRISIYYQIYDPPTHRKCYQFVFNDLSDITFLGSSNFSNSGFFSHNEILAEVVFDMNQLLCDQKKISINCTDSSISRYIDFYSSKSLLVESIEEENRNMFKTVPSIEPIQNRRLAITHEKEIKFFRRFSIPIMRKDDPRSLRGINEKLRGGSSYLQDSPGSNFTDYFIPNQKIKVVVEDFSFELDMRMRTGPRNKIYWENLDMYDFFSEIVGLNNGEEIEFDDLCKYGIENMYMERIGELMYRANFSSPYQ